MHTAEKRILRALKRINPLNAFMHSVKLKPTLFPLVSLADFYKNQCLQIKRSTLKAQLVFRAIDSQPQFVC